MVVEPVSDSEDEGVLNTGASLLLELGSLIFFQVLWQRGCNLNPERGITNSSRFSKQHSPSYRRTCCASLYRFNHVVYLTTPRPVMSQQGISGITSFRPTEDTRQQLSVWFRVHREKITYLSMSAILAESQVMLKGREEKVISLLEDSNS